MSMLMCEALAIMIKTYLRHVTRNIDIRGEGVALVGNFILRLPLFILSASDFSIKFVLCQWRKRDCVFACGLASPRSWRRSTACFGCVASLCASMAPSCCHCVILHNVLSRASEQDILSCVWNERRGCGATGRCTVRKRSCSD